MFRTKLAGHAERYINFYVASGAGEPVTRTKDFHGALENVDVQGVPGIGHLSIDKNQIMQQKVISAIDAVVFSRRKEIFARQSNRRKRVRPSKPRTGPKLPQARAIRAFRRKWTPVRVKKTRQKNKLEPGSNSIRTDTRHSFSVAAKMESALERGDNMVRKHPPQVQSSKTLLPCEPSAKARWR